MGSSEIQIYNQKQQQRYAMRTGIVVDIQNIGKNKKTIALPVQESLKEVHQGVWLSTETLHFENGNFTNVYNLFWDAKDSRLTADVHSEQLPYYLLDHVEKDPSILAVINGSFFFLIDVVDREPKDYPFHFCMRDGKVIGLSSSDEAVVYTQGRILCAAEPKALGTMRIGKHVIDWVGAGSSIKVRKTATLYNSGSARLIKEYDKKTGVRVGVLDNTCIHTPKHSGVVDLVINENKDGKLAISAINAGGRTHFFEGLFILQIDSRSNKYKVGQTVTPLTLDTLDLSTISSGITVNKSVNNPYFYVPERINSRDARSVIAKDINENIHFIVFDGSKYIPKFNGISANDVKSYLSKDKYKWAYFLDGGSSSRIIVQKDGKCKFYANEFAFKKVTNETFLWDYKRHRKLASSLALKIK